MKTLKDIFKKNKTEKERRNQAVHYLFENLSMDMRPRHKKKALSYIQQDLPIYSFRGSRGKTLLMYAVESGDVDIVSAMIDHGAPLDDVNHFNTTSLMMAAKEGYADIAKVLLKAGADINLFDDTGCNAYLYASSRDHRDLAYFIQGYPERIKRQHRDKCIGHATGQTQKPLPIKTFKGFKR